MIVEFSDARPHREEKSVERVEMPESMAVRFQTHLQRKRDAETERGRKQRLLEIETSLQ